EALALEAGPLLQLLALAVEAADLIRERLRRAGQRGLGRGGVGGRQVHHLGAAAGEREQDQRPAHAPSMRAAFPAKMTAGWRRRYSLASRRASAQSSWRQASITSAASASGSRAEPG